MIDFDKNTYYGLILQGDMPGLIRYLRQYPEQEQLCKRLIALFEEEQYADYPVDDEFNRILRLYQCYARDVFYLRLDGEQAAQRLRSDLAALLGMQATATMDTLEQHIAVLFARSSLHFLGGRTGGYYGPYVWRTTTPATYEVDLPEGVQAYTVMMLEGFISCSWLDTLSFGEITPGGWTGPDGVIHCVKASYDLESEAFQVSLLKHEAQHAMDLARNPRLSSVTLEYRAKLVELIYSHKRNLLAEFASQASTDHSTNGHAMAADKIIRNFAEKTSKAPDEIQHMPLSQVRAIALDLFQESAALLTD